ncbi:relaxin-3 receptor 1-like [Syngnathus acus]|uniref:relaxin-3 receptor 1-like n=1 Tax=Syngnathus acus TaxID=161584 RepID=UPI001885E509|nr:relaxin-3 receptor 1-like [Syngnathus acus]
MSEDKYTVWSNISTFLNLDDIDVSADKSHVLRVFICSVYILVCAAGLVGNLLVFLLLGTRQERKASRMNFFVLNLALTDLQFVLTLPFWAVDTVLDFSWPFGSTMCKMVLSVTVMNMYASVFFLTAMSVTRYLSLRSALKRTDAQSPRSDKWTCGAIWILATVVTLPTSIYSTVSHVSGENLCLLKFPGGQDWLAAYHIQKILVGFLVPISVVSVSYIKLLRVIRIRSMKTSNPKSISRVTKSVTIIVLSFFLCWMPNHAITLWSVLVKLNVANWDRSYYMAHTYVFPLTVCLAHANSCLNPVIYCLMRPNFRTKLRLLIHRHVSDI